LGAKKDRSRKSSGEEKLKKRVNGFGHLRSGSRGRKLNEEKKRWLNPKKGGVEKEKRRTS